VHGLRAEFDPNFPGRGTGHNGRTGYTPSSFCALATHKMTTASPSMFDLAGSSDFNPFAQALMDFLFRHSANP